MLCMVLLIPGTLHADALSSLLTAFMGQGLSGIGGGLSGLTGGSGGGSCSTAGGGGSTLAVGQPANQVIPLLQQILRQNANNGGVDNRGNEIINETNQKIADYQQQNEWERERRLRDDDITRSYPEQDQLSCGLATANQSVWVIEQASDNAVATVIDILTNGMYQSVLSGTTVAAKKKADIWCKLGAVANDPTCKTAPDPLVVGCDRDRHSCIMRKHSIPCDMPAVQQEFARMVDDGYTPTQKHKECVAAILSIANKFEISKSLPTEEELKVSAGITIRDEKKQAISSAWSTMGTALQEFGEVVSASKSSAPGCDKGIRGGGDSVYSILQERYADTNRSNKVAPFGLPPDDFCLSRHQVELGKKMLIDRYNERYAGNMSTQQATSLTARLLNEIHNPTRYRAEMTSRSDYVSEGNTPAVATRAIGSTDNSSQQQLLGALRELTSQIQRMNEAAFSQQPQEVRLKKGTAPHHPAPVAAQNSAEVLDALKEMGIKISARTVAPNIAPNAYNGVLEPITPEFPVLPAQ